MLQRRSAVSNSGRRIRRVTGRRVGDCTWPDRGHPIGRSERAALVGIAPNACRGCNVVERRCCRIKQQRGIATRCDKHALTCRTAVVLDAARARTAHSRAAKPFQSPRSGRND